MPKTLFQTPRCRTVSLCLQNWFLLRRGGDLQHWSLDNLSLRCSFRVQKKRGLCKGSFRSALERSLGKGLFFHWPHVKAEQPTKPLQVRERKEGVWMSFLLLRTSLVDWKVSKRHFIIKVPLTPWTSTSVRSQLTSTVLQWLPQPQAASVTESLCCCTAPGTVRDPTAQNPFQSSMWTTWNGSFVWGTPRVKSLCSFPLVGMREAKQHRNKKFKKKKNRAKEGEGKKGKISLKQNSGKRETNMV